MIIRTASPPGFFYCFFQLSHPFPFLPSPPISPIHIPSSPITPIHSHSSHHIDISIYRCIEQSPPS